MNQTLKNKQKNIRRPAKVQSVKIFMGNCFMGNFKKVSKFQAKSDFKFSQIPRYSSTLSLFSTFVGYLLNTTIKLHP